MRSRLAIAAMAMILLSTILFSCEEDEESKGRELVDMIQEALDFMVSNVSEVEEDKVWDITVALRGVKSGRAEFRLKYLEDYGWSLYGLEDLIDELPEWINPEKISYDVAESYELEHEADIGPFALVSTHMDNSELRRAVLSMAGAYATLDALVWSTEED